VVKVFIEFSWLIPLIPLLCFVIIGFFGTKMHEGGGYLAIAGAAVSTLIAVLVSYEYWTSAAFASGVPYVASMEWFAFTSTTGSFVMNVGVYIDSLACMMMLFSSFISLLIFIYSVGYMSHEGNKKRRYYAEVSLFLSGMLGLVVSSNFLEMFIFWEIMGLCSYLLIGFWSFKHPEGDAASINAASAAKKAFLVTRLGDVSLMGGLFVLLYAFQSLDYTVLFDVNNIAAVDSNMIALAMLLVFGGVIGKSAQFPLHDWLPDAMAGPTTVSALIHAATMVKAGVYLTARAFPLFVQVEYVMLFVAVIGGVTAFIAATMALNNMNIKKVLAFSTLSQLGYMILGLGAGGYVMAIGIKHGDPALIAAGAAGYVAACLHMMNHAFFKALLFLGSGSVIHAVGTEDMRQMGGLAKHMPITSKTMLIGSQSIAGFPLLSGFWSKDLILESVMDAFTEPVGWVFVILWTLAVITALMTAFYMFRMWYMTFHGEEGHAAKHCHGESPRTMTLPLMILSVFAAASGLLILFGFGDTVCIGFDGTKFIVGNGHGHDAMYYLEHIFTNVYTYVTILLALLGIYVAYLMYNKKTLNPGRFNKEGQSFIYRLFANRWWFPEFYDQLSLKLGYGTACGVDFIDKQIIDGTVNGLSSSVVGGGEVLSRAQTGNLHSYAGVVVGGTIILAVIAVALFYFMGGI
jgi:NADH-quinone oxidoreductase subunit L